MYVKPYCNITICNKNCMAIMLLLNSIDSQLILEIIFLNVPIFFICSYCSILYDCGIYQNWEYFPNVPNAVCPKASSLSVFKPHA